MLSGQSIKKEVERGIIIIDPFDESNLGTNSYDLSLGNWTIEYKMPRDRTIDISDERNILSIFADPKYNINDIILKPRQRVLAHTEEFAGSLREYVPMIASRSSFARWGLDVCVSAGFGDVGYRNRWTLELFNFTDYYISIPVGSKICQIYFEHLVNQNNQMLAKSDVYTGQYQTALNSWTPHQMYPGVI